MNTTSRLAVHALALLAIASPGCSAVESPDDDDLSDPEKIHAPRAASLAPCQVANSEGTVGVAASDFGLALAVPAIFGEELVVRRSRGVGCELEPEPRSFAVNGLFDLDDEGDLFLLPGNGTSPGVVSTVPADSYPGGVVGRLDRLGRVQTVLSGGRGFWTMGVAPDGDAMWVTACGPSGIFAVDGDQATPSMTPPHTQWGTLPTVLTDADTLWSVGRDTCPHGEPLALDCGRALTRTTPAGSEEVAPTIVDLGRGPEAATLARCGDQVCGVLEQAVLVWNDRGEVEQTILAAEALAQADERIAAAAGNSLGIYLLLERDGFTRVVFAPRR
jgi:hypothetical protein